MAVGLLAFISANAQVKTDEMIVLDVDSITDEQLDTINVRKKLFINDYSMIGIQYGAGLSQVMWNPSQKQDMLFSPINVGITFTTYQKMFGYMPYFGFQAGIFYGKEGYQFEYNEDKDYIYTIEGAEKAVLDVIEVPLLFPAFITSGTWARAANASSSPTALSTLPSMMPMGGTKKPPTIRHTLKIQHKGNITFSFQP